MLLRESSRSSPELAIARSLRRIRDALSRGSLDLALRHVDRAWRCLPESAAMLAPLYAYLLLLEGRDDYAALGLLQRTLEFGPSPDAAALVALSLLRLERPDDARRHLEAALRQYCVVPGSVLFHVAGAVLLHSDRNAPGWVGRGPGLEILGELKGDETSTVLEVGVEGEASFSQLIRPGIDRTARRLFSFPSPPPDLHSPLGVRIRDLPLLGSGLRVPENFALDGRATTSGARVQCWARLGWQPTRGLRLRIEDENGDRAIAQTAAPAITGLGLTACLNRKTAGLRGNHLTISARLPDGRWQALPDTPLLLRDAVTRSSYESLRLHTWSERTGRGRFRNRPIVPAALTDVIIPVYRGREETLACVASALATTGARAQIIVVDDATDDSALAAALDDLSAQGRITLLRNGENLGFAASVNHALALHPTNDVVLLNSDTRVYGDWLGRLRTAAYSAPDVATVTPLSNAGSIASYPHAKGAEMSPDYAAGLHSLAVSTHAGRSAEIPVGVGFCLYIRRDCLQAVGDLNAALFGKGYGEEVDFCLRARRRGWSHRLAADVFVYHAGGTSFAGRSAALLDRSQRLLNLRYPGYEGFIASFLSQDPLNAVRRRLDEHRLSAFQGRFVLMVTLAMTGGVERFVNERCRDLRARGLHPLILRPSGGRGRRRCELSTDALEVPNLRFDIPKDLEALTALLRAVRLDAIEMQHFLHLDARVIDAVRSLAVPYDVFVHDYAWICPRVTLIDGSGRYCGEPSVQVCERCVRRHGSSLGEPLSVAALRRRSDAWLRGARRVFAPSLDTSTRLQRHFSGLDVRVQPHAALEGSTPLPPRPVERPVLRVALLGAIGDHKGYRILLACARNARARRLPIEFTVIGYTSNDAPLLATGKVFVTGRYGEPEPPYLLRREHPDVIWFPSVWPETWCYTLDYALSAGVPIVAFDLGAIAERLRVAGTGELLPLGIAPRQVNDRLLLYARTGQPRVPRPSMTLRWPLTPKSSP